MTDGIPTPYDVVIQKISKERSCSLRTAARIYRQKPLKAASLHRQAVEVAAHADWGNATDIPSEIRELAEVIELHGSRAVSNSDRNRILRHAPLSMQVARR